MSVLHGRKLEGDDKDRGETFVQSVPVSSLILAKLEVILACPRDPAEGLCTLLSKRLSVDLHAYSCCRSKVYLRASWNFLAQTTSTVHVSSYRKVRFRLTAVRTSRLKRHERDKRLAYAKA